MEDFHASIFSFQFILVPLHPLNKSDVGGIAQLVRAHDS